MFAKNTVGSMRSIYEGYQSEISVAILYCYKFGLRSWAHDGDVWFIFHKYAK